MKNLLIAAVLLLNLAGLSTRASAACTTQTISIGETKSAALAADDCIDNNINGKTYYYDYYQFSGSAGQQIAILNSSSAIDTDLTLYLLDGTALYDDDSGGGSNARIPASGFYTLPATGTYRIAASSAVALQTGAYTLSISSNAVASRSQVFEFYHAGLDHYFMTSDSNEAAGIDNGSAGPGWARTGNIFNAGGSTPVCRFYGSVSPGPNSHFFTVDAGECDFLKQLQASSPATEKRWNYEGLDFVSTPTTLGVCEAGTVPVFRAYNNGYARGVDSNHRITRSANGIQEVADRGWISEGILMCAPASTNTGVTGGTFAAPGGAASVSVAQGTMPSSVHASTPSFAAVSALPGGLLIDSANGDINVTKGGAGYGFDLSGDKGFYTSKAGAVTITIPFDASGIPAADLTSPVKVMARIFNPADGTNVDLAGTISSSGGAYKLTVETRGLPTQFTVVVIYNRYMDSVLEDQSAVDRTDKMFASAGVALQAATSWPSALWCIAYNANNPSLIAAVKQIRGISTNPTLAEIRNTISFKAGARKAQLAYQGAGFLAPDLYIGTATCGGSAPHYTIHMSSTKKSAFYGNSADEQLVSPEANHYGRIYMNYKHVPIMGHVVAHEMHHGIQSAYGLYGYTSKGYKEGTATIYGSTIYNGGTITVRSETQMLDYALMTPDLKVDPKDGCCYAGPQAYANQDFFAYVGKQYNSSSLSYIAGMYSRMNTDFGGQDDPAFATIRTSMDTYFRSAFALSLKDIYLDYVKQRVFTHNAASQLGHANDVVNGFANQLFYGDYKEHTAALPVCNGKLSGTILRFNPLSSNYIRIKPTGVLVSGDGPKITVKLTPSFGAVGGAWSGYSVRNNVVDTLKATNTYLSFGKPAGEEIVLLIANTDLATAGTMAYELSCETLQITGIAPAKGAVDTAVTITGVGFGTAADTRSVSFNGVKATSVTWNSDTQAVAKVPANASTGDVVVEVNGSKSNGVNFEVVAQCSATQNAGGDTPDTRTIELGKKAGSFVFSYNTYSVKDQILVKYQGATLFDTGCVGTASSKTISYSGNSTQINVQVIPNCSGGTTGTAWDYSVACP